MNRNSYAAIHLAPLAAAQGRKEPLGKPVAAGAAPCTGWALELSNG
jgi:hypothetical protein